MTDDADLAGLRLLGERLCLNFANTMDPRQGDHPREFLTGYPDLVAWSVRAVRSTGRPPPSWPQRRSGTPTPPRRVYAEAIRLREALYEVFSAVAAGTTVPEAALATVNAAAAAAFAHARVEPDGTGYRWGWRSDPAPWTGCCGRCCAQRSTC